MRNETFKDIRRFQIRSKFVLITDFYFQNKLQRPSYPAFLRKDVLAAKQIFELTRPENSFRNLRQTV